MNNSEYRYRIENLQRPSVTIESLNEKIVELRTQVTEAHEALKVQHDKHKGLTSDLLTIIRLLEGVKK